MTEHDQRDDAALVAAAAGGSEHAFRSLYRAYVRPVYGVAYAIVGDRADAEDVTQETFLTAWRKLPGFELAGPTLLPWLATICRLQAANRVRRQSRDRRHTATLDEDMPDSLDIGQQIVDAEQVALILAQVRGLGDVDRQIFRLCVTEGYAYQAAADELGVAHGVVRNRLSRMRTHMRAAVTESEST